MSKNNIFIKISAGTIKRYSDRFKSLGNHVRTLGWGSREQQQYRFEQTLKGGIDFRNQTIADVGCGFGDYYSFLRKRRIILRKYIGLDINNDLLSEARRHHSGTQASNVQFRAYDVLNQKSPKPIADVVIMLGVLNFNQKKLVDNYEYSFRCLRNALSLAKRALIVDFLSSHLSPGYPREDFIFYHDPSRTLEMALRLTPNVLLKHDYSAIPQKEFMLFVIKKS